MMAAGRQRTVELKFAIDDSQVGKGVQSIDSSTQSISSKLSRAGTAIKVGFAAAAASGVKNVVGNLAELAVAAEGIERRFETVFGNTTDTMASWIDSQNEAFGISEVQLKGMAAGIQDLLVPMGFAREEAAGMTREILETANALSEWTGGAVSTEQAVDAVAKAMLGEREQLKGLGVAIKEADVQAEVARMGLDGLTGAALEQAKAQATLNLILGKSTDALNAYASGADTAARSQKELTARYEDAKQALADRFLPVWQDTVVAVDDATSSWQGFFKVVDFGPLDPLIERIIESTEKSGDLSKTWKDVATDGFDVAENARFMRQQFQELAPAMESSVGPAEQLAAAFSAQASALAAINDPLARYGELVERILGGGVDVSDVLRLAAQLGDPNFAGITEAVAPGSVTLPPGATRNIQEELDRRIRQVAQ